MKLLTAISIICFLTPLAVFAAPELVPSKEVPNIKITPDTQLKVFATQKTQGVFSPTALCIDEQGKVLVTETWRFMGNRGIDDNRQRRYWIHEDIAAQTTADRMAMYKKWYPKHPPEHYTRHAEKIRMLADSNGDGVADKHTIFADGFNDPLDGTAAGIYSHNGNVYFACIPHIWLLKDKNGDGVADSKKSLQDGFGVRVSFSGHDLNGFAYGPDGRIYATVGDRGFNIKTKEGKHYAYPGQGAILRFDPDGSNMEVVHTGLRNPKEIAFDQFGNAITVDNNSDQGDRARVVYIMEGADSGWRMGHQVLHSFHRTAGLEKRPINRWMQEKMWQPRNASQPAYILPPLKNLINGPSGLTYHPGPPSYPGKQGHFLVCDYRGSAAHSEIVSFGVIHEGAGMKVSESFVFNKGTAVTDVEYGYDGKIYVADFISGWQTHQAGRVYTLSKKGSDNDATIQEVSKLIAGGFDQLSTERLIKLMAHADMRIRLRAQFALAKKNDVSLLNDAWQLHSEKKNLLGKLHSVWAMGMVARGDGLPASKATIQLLTIAMNHKDEEVLAQVAKCLGEAKWVSEKQPKILGQLLRHPSPRVSAFAAISMGRLKQKHAFHSFVELLEKNANKDVFLRHAYIMGMLGTADESQILSLAKHKSDAVRLSAAVALRRLKSKGLVTFLSDKNEQVRDEAIRALHDLEIKSSRNDLALLLDGEKTKNLTPMMQRRLIHAAFRAGGDENITRLLRASDRSDFHIDQRREAVRLLSLWNSPPKIDQSLGRWSPLPNRKNEQIKTLLQKDISKMLAGESPLTAELLALSTSYQLKLDAIPPARLLAIVRNAKLPSAARAEALKSLAQNPPTNFDKELTALVKNKNPLVAATALELAMTLSVPNSYRLVVQATAKTKPLLVRQKAWSLTIGTGNTMLQQELASAVRELAAGKGDKECALEIITSAEVQKHSLVVQALAKYKASLDPKNPISPFLDVLHGGDARKGASLFASHGSAQCMRCHTTEKNHDVAMAGPNLAGVAKRGDRKFLLESLIAPNAKVAKGFGKVSSMPPVGSLLNKQEIRDIVAYLSTLTN
ncbi:MAG: DUF7133 domain-containing protein [Akkermansiaceae bacterium]